MEMAILESVAEKSLQADLTNSHEILLETRYVILLKETFFALHVAEKSL